MTFDALRAGSIFNDFSSLPSGSPKLRQHCQRTVNVDPQVYRQFQNISLAGTGSENRTAGQQIGIFSDLAVYLRSLVGSPKKVRRIDIHAEVVGRVRASNARNPQIVSFPGCLRTLSVLSFRREKNARCRLHFSREPYLEHDVSVVPTP